METFSDAKARAEMGSLADYNVYAANAWLPLMRHDWNNGNTLPQWQQRFDQDKHSRQMTVDYRRSGTAFKLLAREGLDVAGPLPAEVQKVWKPANAQRVGANLTEWPKP
jgi:hypothetical protein